MEQRMNSWPEGVRPFCQNKKTLQRSVLTKLCGIYGRITTGK